MNVLLRALNGSTPLGFLAALGVLVAATEAARQTGKTRPRLGWSAGDWRATLDGDESVESLARVLREDRQRWAGHEAFRFAYPKVEKAGTKSVHGLQAPVEVLRAWLSSRLEATDLESVRYFSALMSETSYTRTKPDKAIGPKDCADLGVCVAEGADLSRLAIPTHFDFTSRNAQFLDQLSLLGQAVKDRDFEALCAGQEAPRRSSRTLRWDQAADAPAALYGSAPAPSPVLEWLAFRAIYLFPVTGQGETQHTTACSGRRKAGRFHWATWDATLSLHEVGLLLRNGLPAKLSAQEREARGLLAVFETDLTKAADGYDGVFSPTRTA